MPHITDLPLELFLLDIFWRLSLPDVLSLASCSKDFNRICSDDVFWRQKIEQDMEGVPRRLLALRRCSFKTLYLRIRRPQIYVWGSALHGCMGPRDAPMVAKHMYQCAIPAPVPFGTPFNARVVQLVAGGSSFIALDDQGRLHFWGTLSLNITPFVQVWDQWGGAIRADSGASTAFSHPVRLNLPVQMTHVSAGLSHIVSLDNCGHIWVFTSCLRPYRLISPLLDGSTPGSTPTRVVAGTTSIAVLTEAGGVFVMWPFRGRAMLHTLEYNLEHHHDCRLDDLSHHDVVFCEPWDNELTPLQLPALPSLPCPPDINPEEFDTSLKLTSIAAGHNFLIGLTNFGHVLKINLRLGDQDGAEWARYDDWGLSELEQAFVDGRERWVYLRDFNGFHDHPLQSNDWHAAQTIIQNHKITQVSAYAEAFCAFSKGTSIGVPQVFLTEDTVAQRYCFKKPSLQGRNIASAALGHSHRGVVTEDGELLTWGSYTAGALGLGDPRDLKLGQPGGYHAEDIRERVRNRKWVLRVDPPPPDVDNPSPVRFDWIDGRKCKYVLSATVGDAHSGALVVDLEEIPPDAGNKQCDGWFEFFKQKFAQMCRGS